jgi:signal transduction histidine kinase
MLISPEGADSIILKRDNAVLNRLVQVSLILNSMLDLDRLLQLIMDVAAEITDAGAASIMLMDKNTNQLFFTASTGTDIKKLQRIPVPLDGSIAGTIVTENRAIIIDESKSDPRHYSQVDDKIDFQTTSLVGVPMRVREEVIGVLEALNKKPGVDEGRFDEEDVRRLTILAAQAAVAIENARLIEALQKALDDLDRLDKLKSDFIAIASHELRTPLGVILGYASFLKDEAEGEVGEHADQVLNSALRMRNLIEDMANLTHVKTEDDFNAELVTINSIMREAQQDMAELAEAKGQAFIVDVPVEQIEINADRPKLVLALTNVLNNAVKFTPGGGVITLGAESKKGEVWLMVKDTGTGLAASELDRIFDQFYQVEDHMTRRHGGLGLGLAIAKAIVEKHEGRIWVESQGLGRGSTFYLGLPLAYP